MIITIEEAKEHLRIDSDEDNMYIKRLIKASEQFIKNATGKTFNEDNELAKEVCLLLVADMYENRVVTSEKVGITVRQLVTIMLTQLAYDAGVAK